MIMLELQIDMFQKTNAELLDYLSDPSLSTCACVEREEVQINEGNSFTCSLPFKGHTQATHTYLILLLFLYIILFFKSSNLCHLTTFSITCV